MERLDDIGGRAREKERTRARRLEKLRFWRSACSIERPIVTIFNPQADAPRLFFFHGDWDNGGLYMARLANEFGFPVVALAPHLEPVPATIRAMAQDRIREILTIQPEGPYRIGGFCNGALVAYEAAQLLMERGLVVEVLLLVAPPSLNASRSYRCILALTDRLLTALGAAAPARRRRAAAVMSWVTALRRLTGYSSRDFRTVFDRKRFLRAANRKRLQPKPAHGEADLGAEVRIDQRRRMLLDAYRDAIHLYRPAPMPAPERLVVFGTGLDASGRPRPGYDAAYDGRAWGRLCPQTECIPVAGDHYTCIADHAANLASAVSAALTPAISGQQTQAASDPAYGGINGGAAWRKIFRLAPSSPPFTVGRAATTAAFASSSSDDAD